MIWANFLFSFNMSFLLRKVEDKTTISISQSLTLVSIKDCTLRVLNETTTLFLLRVIIKAIFILLQWVRSGFWMDLHGSCSSSKKVKLCAKACWTTMLAFAHHKRVCQIYQNTHSSVFFMDGGNGGR